MLSVSVAACLPLEKKFLSPWVSSSFIFQYKWAAFSSIVLRRSTFDIFWGLFNLVWFYAQLLTSLCSHPFPFFPFVMLSIFLLNFLIFSAIAPPTRSCDDASKELVSKVSDAVLNQIKRRFRTRKFPPFSKFFSIHL